ncbi:hypothetical protein WMY93_028659 [Mugilogobius chulae]|uniref:TNF family profile domain-containing protein n=1 Tax=Mugilogobius chulae TaxID=88201 RepID=A0AAW0MPZ6_9GOBI
MASLAGVDPENESERRLSWPVLLLTLAAVTSSSLSALSLYQLVVLHAEVEGLKSEVCRRRQDGQDSRHRGQMDTVCAKTSSLETLRRSESEQASLLTRKKRMTGEEILVSQPCLQLLPNSSRAVSLKVFYRDIQIIMGHMVIRWKTSVVGNEAPHVVLFRCIKNMRHEFSYNTCYTGGIVKLESGDHLEMLIPRKTANISLDGESTFMGAIKLI